MTKFSHDELKQRAFERAALVLRHFYEEQKDEFKDDAKLHTRIFETLIAPAHIDVLGMSEELKKQNCKEYREHVVPCAWIRNRAFAMYHEGATENDVASMVRRLLKIALISSDEANIINKKYKYTMPDGWKDDMKYPITARLDYGKIKLIPRD